MKSFKDWLIAGLIFALAFFVRVYKQDQFPPSLNWDEAAAAYNAYTISRWGKDEWGNKFPLVFTSFRDDKHPVHIYLTVPFVALLGNTDFAARLSGILASSFSVLAIYFLAFELFKKREVAFFSAFFLAFSPYSIHFGRGLWEVNFALVFFIVGFWLLWKGLKKQVFLYGGFFSLGMSLYSYHSSKVVVIPLVFLFLLLFFKDLVKLGKHFYLSFLIFFIFLLGLVLEPRLLGLARIKQTSFDKKEIENTFLYKKTGINLLGSFEIAVYHYPQYFSKSYLFEKGSQVPRESVKVFGEFYKIDALFLLIGFLILLAMHSKTMFFILAWLLLAPLPSAISSDIPNAGRAMFMLGSMHLIAGLGAAWLFGLVKNKPIRFVVGGVIIILVLREFIPYYRYLLYDYPRKDAHEWQYGMKEIVYFVRDNPKYGKVYMDIVRNQPYIFFAYYLKVPLPEFLGTIKYDQTEAKSYNTIAGFGKYQFGGWDWVESQPVDGYLYILEPYKYSGLKYRDDFQVVKLVKNPDGGDAFYLVSTY